MPRVSGSSYCSTAKVQILELVNHISGAILNETPVSATFNFKLYQPRHFRKFGTSQGHYRERYMKRTVHKTQNTFE